MRNLPYIARFKGLQNQRLGSRNTIDIGGLNNINIVLIPQWATDYTSDTYIYLVNKKTY